MKEDLLFGLLIWMMSQALRVTRIIPMPHKTAVKGSVKVRYSHVVIDFLLFDLDQNVQMAGS